MNIGFDYSSSTVSLGMADEQKLYRTASFKVKNRDDPLVMFKLFDELKQELLNIRQEFYPSNCVWIEEPWINGRVYPRSAVLLTRMATYIELAAIHADYTPHYVHPLTWRKGIYGPGKHKDAKKLALAQVELKFSLVTKDHNIAEASLIALYGALQETVE